MPYFEQASVPAFFITGIRLFEFEGEYTPVHYGAQVQNIKNKNWEEFDVLTRN